MSAITDALNAIVSELQGVSGGLRGIVKQVSRAGGGGGVSDAVRQVTGLEKQVRAVFTGAITDGLSIAVKGSGKVVETMFEKGFVGGMSKGAKFAEKTISNVFNAAMSALKSPRAAVEGIVGGLFKGVGEVGKELAASMARAGKALEGNKKGGMLGGAGKMLGKLMRGLGPLVSMLGTVASLFSGLIGLLIDAEAQAKGLNKSMIEGGIAGGDLANQAWDIRDAMKGVRDAALDVRNNFQWGTVAKDQIEILGAFNEAGFVLKEMTKDTTDAKGAMQDYQDVTKVALTYSKLLGLSAREIATQQAEYMESLGSSLSFVESQFNAVFKVAQLSGFGVKRFYGMVQQATSGMSLYNSRLDEAAGLLIRLGKILGSRVAGDFLQELRKGFVDESMTDRFKRVMTTGSGKMEEIFENSADDIAFAFNNKLAKMPEGTAKQVKDIMASAGLEVDIASEEGRSKLIDQLAKMDPKEQAKVLAEIRAEDEGMARELNKLMKVSEGAAGGLGNMAKNLGALDMGGTLAAKLASANAIIGKPLHEMSAIQLAAFENITGISGEQREILMDVSQGLTGQFDVLKDIAADPAAQYAGKKQEEIRALQQKQLEAYGAFVDTQGNILQAQTDSDGNIIAGTEKAINDMGEYIQSQGDMIARATEAPLDENTAFAKAIAANTTDLATIMEMGVQWVLEQIYSVMLDLWSFLSGSTGVDAEDRREALKESQDAEKKFLAERGKVEEQIAKTQKDLDTAKDPESRVALAKQLEGLQAKSQNLAIGAATERERQKGLSSAMDKGAFDEARAGKFDQILSAVEQTQGADAAEAIRKQVEGTLDKMTFGMSEESASMVRDALMQNVSEGLMGGRSVQDMFTEQTSANNVAQIAGELAAGVTEDSVAFGPSGLEGMAFNAVGDLWGGVGVDITEGARAEKAGAMRSELQALARMPEALDALGGDFTKVGMAGELAAHGTTSTFEGGMDEYLTQQGMGAGQDFDQEKLQAEGQKAFDAVYQEGVGSIVQSQDAADEAILAEMGRQIELDEEAKKQRGDLHKRSLAEQSKMLTEQSKEIAKELVKEQTKQQLMQAAMQQALAAGQSDISPAVLSLIEEASSDGPRAYAAQFRLAKAGILPGGLGQSVLDMRNADATPAQDFILRPGGNVVPFSGRDTILGARTGGPLDRLLQEGVGGGGAGGTTNVTNHITNNISGDTATVYRTVKQVFKEAGLIQR